jgi:photosystem II stability/assembly factor-like uncharacterized protein
MRFSIILVLLSFSLTISANSQWKSLGLICQTGYGGPLAYSHGKLWVTDPLSNKLWVTENDGGTWQSLIVPFSFQDINDINFLDEMNGIVAADSLYITADGGMNWRVIYPWIQSWGPALPGYSTFQATFVGSVNKIVISVANSPFLSEDGGLTWKDISPKVFIPGSFTYTEGTGLQIRKSDLAISYLYDLKINNTYNRAFIFSTTDNGLTWSRTGDSLFYDCFSFAYDPCDENSIYVCNEGSFTAPPDSRGHLCSSHDGGLTFSYSNPRERDYYCGSIITAPNGTVYAQTNDDTVGILRSTDRGKTWKGIGGPVRTWKTVDTRRICCKDDNTVFSIDAMGNVIATFNSGGDSLSFSSNTTYHFSSTKIINDSSGVIVHLPIYLHHSGSISTVDMTMHYPSSPLQYLGGALVNGKSIDVPNSQWPGRAQLHFDGSDLNALTDSLVGYVNFKWSPLEFDCTFINFDSITPQFVGDCGARTSTPEPFKGIIGAYQWCGESSVTTHQESTLNFTVIPNPSHGIFTVSSNEYSGNATITLFDELGKVVIETRQVINSSGVQIDASKVSAGNYFLRIEISGGKKTYSMKII